ncbi:hypothetical protein PF003_g2478 [Phytophthora fragariae]|nr:hypothetical protein PF003_g2478 [Phytophthora fragariae]
MSETSEGGEDAEVRDLLEGRDRLLRLRAQRQGSSGKSPGAGRSRAIEEETRSAAFAVVQAAMSREEVQEMVRKKREEYAAKFAAGEVTAPVFSRIKRSKTAARACKKYVPVNGDTELVAMDPDMDAEDTAAWSDDTANDDNFVPISPPSDFVDGDIVSSADEAKYFFGLSSSSDDGDTAPTHAILKRAQTDREYYIYARASGEHNHALTDELWDYYAEDRTIHDPALLSTVADMRSAGSSSKGILAWLRKKSGKKTKLKDWAEDEYIEEYNKIGSHPPIAEHSELSALAVTVTKYAFDLVTGEFKYATTGDVHYQMTRNGHQVVLLSSRTAISHTVDTKTYQCDSTVLNDILTGGYSYDTAVQAMKNFNMQVCEVKGDPVIRPLQNEKQLTLDELTKVVPLDRVMRALSLLASSTKRAVACWPDIGDVTREQLEFMALYVEAKQHLEAVAHTIEWVDKVSCANADIEETPNVFSEPLQDRKETVKVKVKALNLRLAVVGNEAIDGFRLLSFRHQQWLSTTAIITAMKALAVKYGSVGVVSPSFMEAREPDRKRIVANAYNAFSPVKRDIIGALNFGQAHWVSYHIDMRTSTCRLFDPLQGHKNYIKLRTTLKEVVEPLLPMNAELKFFQITSCLQQDSDNCGLWRLVMLELALANDRWNKALYKVVPYLRLRYLDMCTSYIEERRGDSPQENL